MRKQTNKKYNYNNYINCALTNNNNNDNSMCNGSRQILSNTTALYVQ